MILEFCIGNNFIVTSTHFQHKEIHIFTRKVVSRREKSILVYITVEQINRGKLIDARVKRSCEIGSEHFLLQAVFKKKASIQISNR